MNPSNTAGVQRDLAESQVARAWDHMPEAVGPYLATLPSETVEQLKAEAIQTFTERSGLNAVEDKNLGQFTSDHQKQFETLAANRVLAALAGEAHRRGDITSFRLVARELQGSGNRKEQK